MAIKQLQQTLERSKSNQNSMSWQSLRKFSKSIHRRNNVPYAVLCAVKDSIKHTFFVDSEQYLSENDTTRLELFEPLDVRHNIALDRGTVSRAGSTRYHNTNHGLSPAIPTGTFVVDRTNIAAPETGTPALAQMSFEKTHSLLSWWRLRRSVVQAPAPPKVCASIV